MIEVKKREGNEYEVSVRQPNGESHHRVTMTKEVYRRLSNGHASEDELLAAAFRFLLKRESKEHILARFDIMTIAHYFPDFERELPNYFHKK